MKKTVLRSLSLIMAIFMLLGTAPYAGAIGAGDFTYSIDENGKALITSYIGSSDSVTIPAQIDGHDVKAIDDYAFNGNTAIVNVTLSEGIKSIGHWSFLDCSTLESITLPQSLIEIQYNAFGNCTALRNINLPANLTYLGDYAFYNCKSLTSITVPGGIKTIHEGTFALCTSLKDITIEKGITEIGGYTFNKCEALQKIIIPSTVSKIADSAFPSDNKSINIYFEGSSSQWSSACSYSASNVHYNCIGDLIPVSSVTLSSSNISMNYKSSASLSATVEPSDASNTSVTWSSSNPKVASVDSVGNIRALSQGSAVITATTADGLASSCNVTVKLTWWQWLIKIVLFGWIWY
jgi:hypothetical protein